MYPESITPATEFTPPGTLLETIDYLGSLLYGATAASKTAIERLNAAVYGVTGNLLFDIAEQGDDLGLIQ